MGNPQKAKGTAYEYKIRDILTKTFDKKFERVPMSGALSYLKGDVWSPYWPEIPWCIECKHHKEVDWNNLLTATKSNLVIQFWEQTIREAKVMNKLPLLIYRWNRGKNYAVWSEDNIACDNQITIKVKEHRFHMALLDDFLIEAKKVIKV